MRGSEELKLIDDGGSFDRLAKTMEEAANGDRSLKLKLLTESVLKGFVDMHFRKATERKKSLAVKEKESNFVDLNIRIPKKIRSKGSRRAARIDSSNKSITERCCLGVVEEEGQTVKKPAVKKQNKADRLKKNRNADSCLEEDREKKRRTTIKKNNSLKKKRKSDSCLEEEDRKKKRRTTIMKNNFNDQLGLNPPPDLPQEFKDQIKRMNGTNVVLVIQKKLTYTDMNNHQGRFSMPNGQVRSHEFLSDEDIHKLSQKGHDGISCSLIQPCLEEITELEFKKWDMNKTFMYSLIKKWKYVTSYSKNQLAEGSKVQVWSFRVGSELWFAMVKLK